MQTNEQKRGFTKREKRLLLLMAVIGFSALMIVYVIIPLHNRLQDENERYNAVTLEQMQFNLLLSSAPTIRGNHEAALEDFYEARDRFLNESHVGEVSRLLTELCLAHNLDVLSQRLTPPTEPVDFNAFLVMTAVKSLTGHYNDIQRFLDTIENTEYLRVTHYSFNMRMPDEEYDFLDFNRININIEIIMMQDLNL